MVRRNQAARRRNTPPRPRRRGQRRPARQPRRPQRQVNRPRRRRNPNNRPTVNMVGLQPRDKILSTGQQQSIITSTAVAGNPLKPTDNPTLATDTIVIPIHPGNPLFKTKQVLTEGPLYDKQTFIGGHIEPSKTQVGALYQQGEVVFNMYTEMEDLWVALNRENHAMYFVRKAADNNRRPVPLRQPHRFNIVAEVPEVRMKKNCEYSGMAPAPKAYYAWSDPDDKAVLQKMFDDADIIKDIVSQFLVITYVDVVACPTKWDYEMKFAFRTYDTMQILAKDRQWKSPLPNPSLAPQALANLYSDRNEAAMSGKSIMVLSTDADKPRWQAQALATLARFDRSSNMQIEHGETVYWVPALDDNTKLMAMIEKLQAKIDFGTEKLAKLTITLGNDARYSDWAYDTITGEFVMQHKVRQYFSSFTDLEIKHEARYETEFKPKKWTKDAAFDENDKDFMGYYRLFEDVEDDTYMDDDAFKNANRELPTVRSWKVSNYAPGTANNHGYLVVESGKWIKANTKYKPMDHHRNFDPSTCLDDVDYMCRLTDVPVDPPTQMTKMYNTISTITGRTPLYKKLASIRSYALEYPDHMEQIVDVIADEDSMPRDDKINAIRSAYAPIPANFQHVECHAVCGDIYPGSKEQIIQQFRYRDALGEKFFSEMPEDEKTLALQRLWLDPNLQGANLDPDMLEATDKTRITDFTVVEFLRHRYVKRFDDPAIYEKVENILRDCYQEATESVLATAMVALENEDHTGAPVPDEAESDLWRGLYEHMQKQRTLESYNQILQRYTHCNREASPLNAENTGKVQILTDIEEEASEETLTPPAL